MSYIIVDAEIVIKCCENCLKWAECEKAYNASGYLREYANKKKYVFWGEKWGYQKAFDYLENTNDFDALNYQSCFWLGKTCKDVKRLLILAKNGNPVMLSDEHSFILGFK